LFAMKRLATVRSRAMKVTRGQTVLLTGATGGLGTVIAHAFARRGLNLALVAFPGIELSGLQSALENQGVKAAIWMTDLRDPHQRRRMVVEVLETFGRVDLLINNAGVEFTAAYHEQTEDGLGDILNVNLAAPMVLTRLVLPDMLQRRTGHIVNISSLAGKSGPAFQEPYAATKAALVAFTSSLRATYRGTGVSASAVTPGFVEAGIYARLKTRSGCSAPRLLGTSKPEAVARAVMEVIERDLFEKIVNPVPARPLLAFCALFPNLGEWLTERTGGNEFFRKVAERLRESTMESANKTS